MNVYIEALIAFHIILGAFFIFVGSYGMIKLPELMSRLHGPSKATTLGVGGFLVGSMIHFGATEGRISIQEILITFFLFITAPVTAHFIAKAYMHTELNPEKLPKPEGRYGWNTYASVEDVKLAVRDQATRSDLQG